MSAYKLAVIQHGLEATAGTGVAATFKHFGAGTLKIDDAIVIPEFAAGFASNIVETTFVADTGSTLTLTDTDLSAEAMIWLGNCAIKAVVGPASSFAFTFATTAANTLRAFTWELGTATQEYEFTYGICSKFSVHGDVASNNGRIMYNAELFGRSTAASTVTASLGFLANRESLNINNATIHLDAAGTAAGTAAATAGYLKAFNIDVDTGWNPQNARYADGRATKDFSTATYGIGKITGMVRALLSATAVTEIANARAATSRMMAIKCNGTSSRLVNFKLPLVYTEVGVLGENSDGLILVEFPFEAGYSTTATAQGAEIAVTASGSTTVT